MSDEFSRVRMLDFAESKTPRFKEVYTEMEEIYLACGREPEGVGLGYTGKIQFSRCWDYPYVALAAQPIGAGMKTVDLGCGAGPLPIWLAKQGCESWGLDAGWKYERETTGGYHPEIAEKAGVDVKYLKGNMWSCPDLPTGYFDRTFSVSVIEHLSDDGRTAHSVLALRAMAEMVRITKPGGIIAVTVDWHHKMEFHPQLLIDYVDGVRLLGGEPDAIDYATVTENWFPSGAGPVTSIGICWERV